MGKEIVYCVTCGEKLTEDDFERGKAQNIDGRPYCSRCRPITAPPAPPPRERATERRGQTSTRLRRPPTERVARVPSPAPAYKQPKESRAAWVVGGGVVLALAVVGAMAMTGGKSGPPVETAAPFKPGASSPAKEDFDERLRELEAFAATTKDPQAILARCDPLRADIRGTPLEPRFKQVEFKALERLKEMERSADLDRSLASIRKLMQDDPDGVRRVEVEGLLDSALKKAGPRSGEVQKLQSDYRSQCDEAAKLREAQKSDEAAKRREAQKSPPRPWGDCFAQAGKKIQANDYPGAKVLYLEGLATLPEARPEELTQRFAYAAGLYNLACVCSVEASKAADAARKDALDDAFRYLDRALRGDFGRFRCPCHVQTGGFGHMAEDKDLEAVRSDARYAEIVGKFKQ